MPMTSFEKGLEQGQRMVAEKQLEARFGPLSAAARKRLERMDAAHLEALTLGLLTARSLRDLGLEDLGHCDE